MSRLLHTPMHRLPYRHSSSDICCSARTTSRPIGPGIVKTTRPVAAGIALAAIVNVVLNVVLIPPLGLLGAGLATLVAFGAMATYVFARSQALFPIPYRFRPAIALASAALLASSLVGRWEPDDLWLGISVKLALLLEFLPAAVFFRFITIAGIKRRISRRRPSDSSDPSRRD